MMKGNIYMYRLTQRVFVAALTMSLAAPLFAMSDRNDDVARIQHSREVFEEVMQTPDKGVPREILEGAQCVAIVPSEKSFAIGFGGTYGKGIAMCRTAAGWGAPMFIHVGGGSWGLQLGGESTDVIMIFRSRKGLESLLTNKMKIGGDMSAAAGPVGRNASAATDAGMKAEILTYARSRGAFAGISLNGDVVQPDTSGDKALYGGTSWKQILAGKVRGPNEARQLEAALNRYSRSEGK